MSRLDAGSRTEHDAGRYDRATAEPLDDRDHDTPSHADPAPHDCTGPTCRNLLCVLDQTIARQKAARS